MPLNSPPLRVDFAGPFSDPDGDPLIYSIQLNDNSLCEVIMNSSTGAATLTPLRTGTTTAIVKASDGISGEISYSFNLGVASN